MRFIRREWPGSGFEFVAHALDGDDAFVADLLAQFADVHVMVRSPTTTSVPQIFVYISSREKSFPGDE